MKYSQMLFVLFFTTYAQAAKFELSKQLQCFDGSGSSPLINISEMHSNQRTLEINHKTTYKMNCNTKSDSLNCHFKYGLFNLTKKFSLDLKTVQLVTNLDDSPRNFMIQGLLGKKEITCVQPVY
jgi:hypothetical protein